MDPEVFAVDAASVELARAKTRARTRYGLHRQSHLGPSLNLPAILTMQNDVHARQSQEWRFPLVNAALDQIARRR